MARITKVGLWLLPWFPALFAAVAIYAWRHPTYSAATYIEVGPKGTTTTTYSSPDPGFQSIWLTIIVWLSLISFVVGLVFLIISLKRAFHRRRTREV